jgi:hypothetical protein
MSTDNVERTVRFGVICTGVNVPAWQARCIENLLVRPGVEMALLIIDGSGTKSALARASEHLRRQDRLWTLYWQVFARRRSRSCRPVDMSALLGDVPIVRWQASSGRQMSALRAADVAEVRRLRLDFIIALGAGTAWDKLLDAAQYGVWSFGHDQGLTSGGPPCFWEIYRGESVTTTTLERLTSRRGHPVVLHRGFFRTIHDSYVRNYDQASFGSTDWVGRICADIRNGNIAFLTARPDNASEPETPKPGATRTARFLLKLLRNHGRNQWAEVWRAEHWNVGVVDAPIHSFLAGGPMPPVRWLPECPAGRFVADPFGLADGGQLRILAEEYDYVSSLGRIVSVEVPCSAPLAEVMHFEGHVSYPFLFRHAGSIYCVPCLSPARGVDLFRAAEFPVKWEKVATLIAGFAAQDATIFEHEGRWWLLCTASEDTPDTKLHAWFASHPAGPWEPHSLNPLKTDVRSSRPGGTPFVHGGCLYRPAQDGSTTYGGAIVLNRVVRLTPTEFEEETVAKVDPVPGPYSCGLHTLSAIGDSTLVDGKRFRFSSTWTRRQLRRRIRKLLYVLLRPRSAFRARRAARQGP